MKLRIEAKELKAATHRLTAPPQPEPTLWGVITLIWLKVVK
jgi:hypothetical protein